MNGLMRAGAILMGLSILGVGCGRGAVDPDADGDGQTLAEGDCADDDPTRYDGARETPYDGIDQDCDGEDLLDVDGDGHDGLPAGGDDCDDEDAAAYPGADEVVGDDRDQDCDGEDLVDGDGDGFSAEDDCDDADPDVYPGREPGAGPDPSIDYDCDGDADDDGAPAESDCDDADPAVHPGAEEVPYDGIDQDCQDGDLDDVDEDGYAAEDAGGPDCDDDAATIYPGRAEIAYDGVDQDCDGEDLRDVDGDGHESTRVGGDDCDDAKAAIYPGAAEVPYDGIDQDCDAVDLVDPDRDGHCAVGVTPTAPLDALCLGGYGDCADDDRTIHPGALDLADGVDGDCSGAADDPTAFGSAQARLGSTVEGAQLATFLGAGDLDGDGLTDLVTASPGRAQEPKVDAQVQIWYGIADLWWGAARAPDVLLLGAAATSFGQVVALGDLNGDGLSDLALGAPGAGDAEDGRVYLVFGATDGIEDRSGDDIEAAADLTLLPGEPGVRFGSSLALGDLDGDGADELVVGGPSSPEYAEGFDTPRGLAWLLPGAAPTDGVDPWPRGEALLDYDALPTRADACWGPADGAHFGQSVSVADVDGDGLGDVSVTTGEAFTDPPPERTLHPAAAWLWLSAGAPVDLCGDARYAGDDDDPSHRIDGPGGEAPPILLGAALLAPVGEGDRGAVGMVFQHLSEEAGQLPPTDVYLVTGEDPELGAWPASVEAASSRVVRVGTPAPMALGAGHYRGLHPLDDASPLRVSLAVGDVDADGRGDLVVGGPDVAGPDGAASAGVVAVFAGPDWLVEADAAQPTAAVTGTQAGALVGDAVLIADLDGDGAPELAVAAPGAASQAGAAAIFPGMP